MQYLTNVFDGIIFEESLKVELHRQELHPYVVIILKSGKVSKISIVSI